MIVKGVFRGRVVSGALPYIKRELIPELFEKCYKVSRNRDFSPELRSFALEIALKLKPLSGASIGDTFENDIMKLIFNATAIANIADNAASSPLTNLECSLHTADPGEAGSQTTSEVTYTSYARVAVPRTSATPGFAVTANSVSPTAAITFPAGTGGSGTVTHGGIGTAHTSTGKLLFSGTVTPNIVTGNGITPSLPTSSTIVID